MDRINNKSTVVSVSVWCRREFAIYDNKKHSKSPKLHRTDHEKGNTCTQVHSRLYSAAYPTYPEIIVNDRSDLVMLLTDTTYPKNNWKIQNLRDISLNVSSLIYRDIGIEFMILSI